MSLLRTRVTRFCETYQLRAPILLAPMAGACPPNLSIAVANAGGLGACGALLLRPAAIGTWVSEVRARTPGGFQINLWIPDPPAARDAQAEARIASFLAQWGPPVTLEALESALPNFDEQCAALLKARPAAASSIMGIFPPALVQQLKKRRIRWFATATTVTEAQQAEAAGADVIVAQGMEAGGHRGAFEAPMADARLVGLFALLPAVVDAVKVPVVGTGGIADARGIAAALMLGASAVQIGTGFLRSPEAQLSAAWSAALARTRPEDTMLTRAFSGRLGRSLANAYVQAAAAPQAPPPAPYPIQRALTAAMRAAAARAGDVERMQAWAGQAAALARDRPAGELLQLLWSGARDLLRAAALDPPSA